MAGVTPETPADCITTHLPARYGGLDVRPMAPYSAAAYISSSLAVNDICSNLIGEELEDPFLNETITVFNNQVATENQLLFSQSSSFTSKRLCDAVSRKMLSDLKEMQVTPRDLAFVVHHEDLNTMDWLEATGHAWDNTRIADEELEWEVKSRFLRHLCDGSPCPSYGVPLDPLGDHCLTCNKALEITYIVIMVYSI